MINFISFITLFLSATFFISTLILNDIISRQALAQIQTIAAIMNAEVEKTGSNPQLLRKLIADLSREAGLGVTYLTQAGGFLHSGEDDILALENLIRRKEIQTAFEAGTGYDIRPNPTQKVFTLYYAARIQLADDGPAVLRLSLPLADPVTSFSPLWEILSGTWLLLIGAGVLLSLRFSRRINTPLFKLRAGLTKLEKGDPGRMYSGSTFNEMNEVFEAVNKTASLIRNRTNTAVNENLLGKSVFESMLEGVIAVDLENRILLMNRAAAKIFHLPGLKTSGKRVEELITNANILKLIPRIHDAPEPVEETIILYEKEEHFYQVLGTRLFDSERGTYGVLIVLRDLTRLHKLETVRREFSMNVSHELKTPLTSIKGFVETLADGNLTDENDKKHFLHIITRETERVIAIVEDLLSLARLEKESENDMVTLERLKLRDVLGKAVIICGERADKKHIGLSLSCPEEIEALLNPRLFEQAVVNLIDNAVKYSNPDTEVAVNAEKTEDEILISVLDCGSGISEEHFSRLFERFYRVDKARSSELGGTGLGLAIVKHIVLAHHGRVDLKSELGIGSTFFIHLPLQSGQTHLGL
jgi:two-component system phosphate regulon sensor histidine kinase PhoR